MRAGLLLVAACGGGGQFGTVRAGEFDASASFAATDDGCSRHVFDSCVVLDPCMSVGSSASAGTITVGSFSFDYQMGGYGNFGISDGAFFSDGDTVPISASGDVVPAFAGTVLAPSKSEVSSPRLEAVIARDRDLVAQWEVGSNLVGLQVTSGDLQVQCTFPASSGTGVVPAEALALLLPGGASVEVANANSVQLEVEDWTVTLIATVRTFSSTVTLE